MEDVTRRDPNIISLYLKANSDDMLKNYEV